MNVDWLASRYFCIIAVQQIRLLASNLADFASALLGCHSPSRNHGWIARWPRLLLACLFACMPAVPQIDASDDGRSPTRILLVKEPVKEVASTQLLQMT